MQFNIDELNQRLRRKIQQRKKKEQHTNQAMELETEEKLFATASKSGGVLAAAAATTDGQPKASFIIQGSLYARLEGGYAKNKIQLKVPVSTTAQQLIEEVSCRFQIDSDSLHLSLASRKNMFLHEHADETLEELGILAASGLVNILYAADKKDIIMKDEQSYDDSDIPLGAEASDYYDCDSSSMYQEDKLSTDENWKMTDENWKIDEASSSKPELDYKDVKPRRRVKKVYKSFTDHESKIQYQEIPIEENSAVQDLWGLSPPNIWKERSKRAEEIEAMQPRTEQDEEAMIQQAIELSRLQALEDEKRRRTLQEEQEIQYMASVSAENHKDQVVDTFQTDLDENDPNKRITPQETSNTPSIISSSTSLREEEALRFGGAKPKFKKIADRFGGWGSLNKSSESSSRRNKDVNSKDTLGRTETEKSCLKVRTRDLQENAVALDRGIKSWNKSTADRGADVSKNDIDCENFWDEDITPMSKTSEGDAAYFGSRKNLTILHANDQLDNCEDIAADENDAEVESYFQDQSFFWKPKRISKDSEDVKNKLELEISGSGTNEDLPSESKIIGQNVIFGKTETVANSTAISHTELKNNNRACDSNIDEENVEADKSIYSTSTLPNNRIFYTSDDDFSNSKFEIKSSAAADIKRDLENFSICDQEKKPKSPFSEQPQDLYNVFLDRKIEGSEYLQSKTFEGAPFEEYSQVNAFISNNSQISSDNNQAMCPSSFNPLDSNKMACPPNISNEVQPNVKDSIDVSGFTSVNHNSKESFMPNETMRSPMDSYVTPENASFMKSQFLPFGNSIAKTMDPSLAMHPGMPLNPAMANPLLMQMQQMMMLSNPFFAQQLHALQMFSLGMAPAFPYSMPVPNPMQVNPVIERHLVVPQCNLQLPFSAPESLAINAFANAELGDGGYMKLPVSKPAEEPVWKAPEVTKTPSLPPGIDVSHDLHPPISDYSFSEIENLFKSNLNSPNAGELFIPAPKPADTFFSNDGDEQQSKFSFDKSSNVLQTNMPNTLHTNHANSSAFVDSFSNIGYSNKNSLANPDGNAERAYGDVFPPQQHPTLSKDVFVCDDLNQNNRKEDPINGVYSQQSFHSHIQESNLGKIMNSFESSDGAMDETKEHHENVNTFNSSWGDVERYSKQVTEGWRCDNRQQMKSCYQPSDSKMPDLKPYSHDGISQIQNYISSEEKKELQ